MRLILIARVLLAVLGSSTLIAEAQEAPTIPVALPPSGLSVVARPSPAAGEIVAAKGGEEVLFVAERGWRPALVTQAVLAGDTLRTGAIGTLALLFADRTQMRVGRNSTLVVRAAAAAGPTELSLTEGAAWARAQRGGGAVIIDTPAATTSIRGTDWAVSRHGTTDWSDGRATPSSRAFRTPRHRFRFEPASTRCRCRGASETATLHSPLATSPLGGAPRSMIASCSLPI